MTAWEYLKGNEGPAWDKFAQSSSGSGWTILSSDYSNTGNAWERLIGQMLDRYLDTGVLPAGCSVISASTELGEGLQITLSFTDQVGAHWHSNMQGWLIEGPMSPQSHDVFLHSPTVDTDQVLMAPMWSEQAMWMPLTIETGPHLSQTQGRLTLYAPEIQGDVLQIGGMGLYGFMPRPTLDTEFEMAVDVPAITGEAALLEAVSDEWFRVDQTATSAQWTQYAPTVSTSTEIMMETAHAELYGWMAVQNEGCGVDLEAVVESGTLYSPTVETS